MKAELEALRFLENAARNFARYTPRRNVSGSYARALRNLVDAARVFAQKSDEQWAQEVIDAREGRNSEPTNVEPSAAD